MRPEIADGFQKIFILIKRESDNDRASAIPMASHVD
jgi:hypothetical protein